MELIRNLFEGFPDLWGGGVAHSVMILALVISLGLALGKIKLFNISLGLTWVLFIGLVFGHFSFNLDEHLLHFLKEFGLILFVYSIGLQVGPSFFASFRRGGLSLNMLVFTVIMISVGMAVVLHFVTGIPITTMAGILSGAVTNTPGLGAAQQANSDLNHIDSPDIAMGYAVTYPMGVIGVILTFMALRYLMRINMKAEEKQAATGLGHLEELTVRPFTVEIENEMIENQTVEHIHQLLKRDFTVSRILHVATGEYNELVNGETVLQKGDKLLVIARPNDVEAITALLGVPTKVDWSEYNNELISRRILVTKPEINGKTLAQLKIRSNFGANITRVNRSGVDLVATSNLHLQMGDRVTVVGTELAISHVEKMMGNSLRRLNNPNLIPIFLGIALGCLVANLPIIIPGIPESLKLGLTGGPLIVALLVGWLGPKHNLVTYTTISANLMIREIGICIFLACVGLGSGHEFFSTVISQQGLVWLGYGVLITILPLLIGALIGRYFMHLNYFTLIGVLAGANTNPPALNYANDLTQSDSPAVGYSTVYPFAMFLRIVTIQILILVLG
ncbi:putative transporter [Prevotella sp.]|uniref:putative transporter n=1 Tax=Prevotella sp. TaxID=59823 RepID=UPI002F9505C1